MAASFKAVPAPNSGDRIFEAFFQYSSSVPRQSFPARDVANPFEAAWRPPEAPDHLILADEVLQLIQDRADIDISGPEFNFVRSIRVFDVYIDDDRHDGDCDRYERVRLGSYGIQGDFGWRRSNRAAVPPAFGPTRSGCSLRARAVFVEWRDYQGNYGFERVDY